MEGNRKKTICGSLHCPREQFRARIVSGQNSTHSPALYSSPGEGYTLTASSLVTVALLMAFVGRGLKGANPSGLLDYATWLGLLAGAPVARFLNEIGPPRFLIFDGG